MARPIYKKLYDPLCKSDLSTMEIDVSKWRFETLKSPTPKIPQPLAGRPRFVIFADAATRNRIISANLFGVQNADRPTVTELCACRGQEFRNRKSAHTNLIYG